MPINEVFPNPTVKQVIFQVRFPSLFYIESKIGDLQLRLIQSFPKTSLVFRQQVVIADLPPQLSPEGIPVDLNREASKKIWRFESVDGNVVLNVLADSLDISSQSHKTYSLGDGPKFRDVIRPILDSFIELTQIPGFTRIGLRYVDECPVPAMENEVFSDWYNTAFPTGRFNLATVRQMTFSALMSREDHFIRYVERLITGETPKLILDFDGYAENILAEDYLATTDKLHETISTEYENTIKDPVYEYMRQGGNEP